MVNTVSLLTVLIPKLPQLHGVRIFGINKYWQDRRGALPPSRRPHGPLRAPYRASDEDRWPSGALFCYAVPPKETHWGYCHGTRPNQRHVRHYRASTKGEKSHIVITFFFLFIFFLFTETLKASLTIRVSWVFWCDWRWKKRTVQLHKHHVPFSTAGTVTVCVMIPLLYLFSFAPMRSFLSPEACGIRAEQQYDTETIRDLRAAWEARHKEPQGLYLALSALLEVKIGKSTSSYFYLTISILGHLLSWFADWVSESAPLLQISRQACNELLQTSRKHMGIYSDRSMLRGHERSKWVKRCIVLSF